MTEATILTETSRESDVKRRRRGFWPWLIFALIVVGLAIAWSRGRKAKAEPRSQSPAAAAENRVVPVQVTTVTQIDVPIVLEGLGNVTPLATVVIKSQVDGRLDKVFFKEGEQVKKGQLIAQVDPRPFQIQLQQGQAALARDRATIGNARLNLDRYSTLRAQNLVPQQQVDDQRTLVSQTEAALLADEAQINSAQLNLSYSRITSPVTGVTGVRLIDPGNIVHAADPSGIVVVTQLDPIAVLFVLPEDEQVGVSQAMSKGLIQVDAYSRDGDKKLATGRLLLIDNQINTATATIRLKATFDNPDHVLWPNAFVKARMTLDTLKGVLAAPNSAIQRGPQGTFVYVVKKDQTADMRHVTVSTVQGDSAIVQSGLTPGDIVVTEGQNQLRPGAKVSVRTQPVAPSSVKPTPVARPRNAQ
jgi:multidrug efflux system membrane fusion protein